MVFKISLVNLLAQKSHLEFDNYRIPVYVYVEYRSSIRYSITKKGIHIRIPKLIPGISSAKEIEKAGIWIQRVISKKPEVAKRFQVLNYPDSFEIKTTYKDLSVLCLFLYYLASVHPETPTCHSERSEESLRTQ